MKDIICELEKIAEVADPESAEIIRGIFKED